ncbi:MAG: hypothetical protein HY394_00175 [Candidatus Diapherotrites archaeon]|nr:hypothetical protein [Candidatus Diapherotrites archaeon]
MPSQPQGEVEQQQAEGAGDERRPGFFSRFMRFFSFRRRRQERGYFRQQEQAQTHMKSIQDGLQNGVAAMQQEQNPSRRAEIFGQLVASIPSVENPANLRLLEAVRSGQALTQDEVDFAGRLIGVEQMQAIKGQLFEIFFSGFAERDLQAFANLERSNRREFLEVCKAWALKMNISEAEFEQALLAKISPAHALKPENLGRFSAGQGEQPESREMPESEGPGHQQRGARPLQRTPLPRRRRRFPEKEEAGEQAEGGGLEEAGAGAEGQEFEEAA